MIRHIVIVGGGTAGWIAANLLHLRLVESVRRRRPLDAPDPIRITVVSSERLVAVGVGESTTPLFTALLRELGIDEAELIRDAGATYKLGVRFEDWRGDGACYDNPFGSPDPIPASSPPEFQHLAAWLVSMRRSVAGTLVPHCGFMDAGASPFLLDGNDLSAGRGAYAMHVDAVRLAHVLRRRAEDRGVTHLDALVNGVRRDADTGLIASLYLEGGGEVAGDFFIDCSGFQRLLIGRTLASPWESYADALPVDSALLLTGPVKASGPIRPYTRARAAPNGWIWEIPLCDRVGRVDTSFKRAGWISTRPSTKRERCWVSPWRQGRYCASSPARCRNRGWATASRWASRRASSNPWRPRRSTPSSSSCTR